MRPAQTGGRIDVLGDAPAGAESQTEISRFCALFPPGADVVSAGIFAEGVVAHGGVWYGVRVVVVGAFFFCGLIYFGRRKKVKYQF